MASDIIRDIENMLPYYINEDMPIFDVYKKCKEQDIEVYLSDGQYCGCKWNYII